MNQKKAKAKRKANFAAGKVKPEPNYTQIRDVAVKTKGKDGKPKTEYVKESVSGVIVDCRVHGREFVNNEIKAANGNISKFIPAKYGYGPMGAAKY